MLSCPTIASSADLRTLLYQRSHRFRNVIPVCLGPAPNEKWVLASALQKCIRRGSPVVAAVCAETLLAVDPAYLWRRLPTIALEDIAYGDRVLCALTIEASRSSAFRQRIGERQVLHSLVHGLCSASKCRALTDLLMIPDGPTPPASAWYQHVDSLKLSFVDAYLARYGLACAGLGAQVPRLLKMMPADVTVITNEPDPYGDELIRGLPAATFDKHCVPGKRALAYFAKACPDARRYFAQHPNLDPGRALGIVVFLIESAHLDRQLDWPGRTDLRARAVLSDFTAYGLTNAQGQALVALVRQNRAILNRSRRRIMGKI